MAIFLKNNFSYKEYENIVDVVKNNSNIVDFKDVIDYKLDKFCIFRHDVEFSIQRALDLARIESNLGLQSSYFFQLTKHLFQ